MGETQNVYDLPGINRYTDASGVPTFTNKGRGGYDEMLIAPQISQESLDRTLATSPLFANRSADGVSRIDPVSADLARKGFAADQATAEAEDNAAKAERLILKRLPGLPAPELNNALKGVTDLRTAREGKPLSLDQFRAQQAPQLLAGGEPTAGQNLLFGKSPPASTAKIIQLEGPVGADGFPGPKQPYSWDGVNPATLAPVDLSGGAGQGQGQAPAGAIAKLRANPKLAADFKQKYGYLP